MSATIVTLIKRLLWLLVIFLGSLLVIRTWDAQRGPALQPWHTYVPEELSARALQAADWNTYLRHETQLFESVRTRMREQFDASMRVASNRYYEGAPMYPGRFAQDWNRSYVLEPSGKPQGAVVLLHGLTDSPYSLRHVAQRYRQHGYVAIGLRLPAHGTVPGALTAVSWHEWMAATGLAVREARRRAGEDMPLHIVGYSNGAALAMKYTLEAIEDKQLARPDRLLLISPMIGISGSARFAGLAGLPAIFPAFAKAAWLGIEPEYNPFKYNSFPVNAARESWLVTNALRQQLVRLNKAQRLADLPPVLGFQSVVDATVNARDVLTGPVRPAARQWQRNRAVRCQSQCRVRCLAATRRQPCAATPAAGRTAALPDHGHRQRRARPGADGGTRYRTWCDHRTHARVEPGLPARPLFPVACGPALPDQRRVVWPDSGSQRGFRHPPGRFHTPRRARCVAGGAGCDPAHRFEPFLPLPAGSGGSRHRIDNRVGDSSHRNASHGAAREGVAETVGSALIPRPPQLRAKNRWRMRSGSRVLISVEPRLILFPPLVG